jgi:hypothetical protein
VFVSVVSVCSSCFKIESSIPSLVLQPLLGPGLPQKTHPFFSVFCSSAPSSYSQDLRCVPPYDFHLVLGFATGLVKIKNTMHFADSM